MKIVMAVIKPFKLEEVRDALTALLASGFPQIGYGMTNCGKRFHTTGP